MIVGVSVPGGRWRSRDDDRTCCRIRDLRNLQPSLWESVLPEVCLRLPAELERVDAWLDDEAFFAQFREHFDPLTDDVSQR